METPPEAGLHERLERLEHTVAALSEELRLLRAERARAAFTSDFQRSGAERGREPAAAEGSRPFLGTAASAGAASSASGTAAGSYAPPGVAGSAGIASAGPRSASVPQPPRPHAGVPHPSWTADEVEGFVGRYGMLALATVTGLAAVGTFLGWAIAQGMLGPEVRVGLGMLLALGLAATGAWLRPRERSFGAALLGISLAIVHVCGWAASPAKLGLVSATLALGVTVVASGALAIFAQREDDEPLWCVGFGGAALAPFVTGGDSENALLLALFGAVVMLLGAWALRGREWRAAARVLTGSAALFTFGLLAMPHRTGSPLMAMGLTYLVAAGGVLPFASVAMRRGRLRALGVLAAICAVAITDSGALPVREGTIVAVLAAGGIAWLLLLELTADLQAGSLFDGLLGEGATIWCWVDAAVIPLVFLAALLAEVDGPASRDAVAALAAAAVLGAFLARRRMGALRDAAAFAFSCAVLVAASDGAEAAGIARWGVAVVAVAATALAAARRWRESPTWIPVAIVTLLACSAAASGLLADRIPYAYAPFRTHESGIAVIVTAAWFAVARIVGPGRPLGADADPSNPIAVLRGYASHASDAAPLLPMIAWTWTFFWVHEELAGAFSPTVSTLLLISYYAATSVVTVWIGRARGMPTLRHLGLVFALIAAAAAARGAARLDAVWARIAGYLVTSVFLLALAWWYRRRPDGPSHGAELRDRAGHA